VRSLDQEVPILLPGIKVKTGPDDGYAIEAMQIMRFDGNRWRLVGDVVQKPH
jgi:branched-chain amino acid transport system substrate-binding protein